MTTFLTSPFFNSFSNVSSVTALIANDLRYIDKIQFFTAISKSILTYITLTVDNISKYQITIKQYCHMIKTSKVLIFIKKKQPSRINILISNRSITLNEQDFFDYKNIFIMTVCQDDTLVKE